MLRELVVEHQEISRLKLVGTKNHSIISWINKMEIIGFQPWLKSLLDTFVKLSVLFLVSQ